MAKKKTKETKTVALITEEVKEVGGVEEPLLTSLEASEEVVELKEVEEVSKILSEPKGKLKSAPSIQSSQRVFQVGDSVVPIVDLVAMSTGGDQIKGTNGLPGVITKITPVGEFRYQINHLGWVKQKEIK